MYICKGTPTDISKLWAKPIPWNFGLKLNTGRSRRRLSASGSRPSPSPLLGSTSLVRYLVRLLRDSPTHASQLHPLVPVRSVLSPTARRVCDLPFAPNTVLCTLTLQCMTVRQLTITHGHCLCITHFIIQAGRKWRLMAPPRTASSTRFNETRPLRLPFHILVQKLWVWSYVWNAAAPTASQAGASVSSRLMGRTPCKPPHDSWPLIAVDETSVEQYADAPVTVEAAPWTGMSPVA